MRTRTKVCLVILVVLIIVFIKIVGYQLSNNKDFAGWTQSLLCERSVATQSIQAPAPKPELKAVIAAEPTSAAESEPKTEVATQSKQAPATKSEPKAVEHTVVKGDCIIMLAAKNGSSIKGIMDANSIIKNQHLIQIGWTLIIPKNDELLHTGFVQMAPKSLKYWDKIGVDPYGQRSVEKAIKGFEKMPGNIRTIFVAMIVTNKISGETWTYQPGHVFNEMWFGHGKAEDVEVRKAGPFDAETWTAVEDGNMVYHVAKPSCNNWAWWSESAPVPELTPEPTPAPEPVPQPDEPLKPFCGNGIVEQSEECDNGDQNGNICEAPAGGECSYCTLLCEKVTISVPAPKPTPEPVVVPVTPVVVPTPVEPEKPKCRINCRPDFEASLFGGRYWFIQGAGGSFNYWGYSASLFPCELGKGKRFRIGPTIEYVGWDGSVEGKKVPFEGHKQLYGAEAQYITGSFKTSLKVRFGEKEGHVEADNGNYKADESADITSVEAIHQLWWDRKWFSLLEIGARADIASHNKKVSYYKGSRLDEKAVDQTEYSARIRADIYNGSVGTPFAELNGGKRMFDGNLVGEGVVGVKLYRDILEAKGSYQLVEGHDNDAVGVGAVINIHHLFYWLKSQLKKEE